MKWKSSLNDALLPITECQHHLNCVGNTSFGGLLQSFTSPKDPL